ncbi:DUF3054 domain-containing protein [Microbacterium sp. CFH 90308]|uniref:DUF3054 domain-containing protein n=1 Tax=Microbacterium salsuginis TaxID=2722803 RepID=A0ABX1KBR8_9MICO|nr:DUF3054 domain-containing protein [Microbacterium sp. CFH 90308]NLP82866.1 DUF3054 domain-containing protein [Microbacterium sp. CFH 90308]
MTPAPLPRTSTGAIVVAIVLDVALVVGFAAIGRASHTTDIWTGLWQTAWPFLAGLAVGWAVTVAWRTPLAPVRTGLGVWAATVLVGMLLRVASGQGTAIPFVIVASATLFAALVGWRLVAALARMGRGARAENRSADPTRG